MELYDAIRQRRSVRNYTDQPVPGDVLERILDAGRAAPSGANRQPWMFAVVRDPEHQEWIRNHCEEVEQRTHAGAAPWFRSFLQSTGLTPAKPFLTEAPVLLVVFGERGAPYWKESAWLAISHLVLAAASEGLASLTYTPGRLRGIRKRLKVPRKYVLQAILPLGFSAEDAKAPSSLRPRDEVVVER